MASSPAQRKSPRPIPRPRSRTDQTPARVSTSLWAAGIIIPPQHSHWRIDTSAPDKDQRLTDKAILRRPRAVDGKYFDTINIITETPRRTPIGAPDMPEFRVAVCYRTAIGKVV